MEDNKFMVGAPKMNALTYGTNLSDTVQSTPTRSQRRQEVQSYDEGIPTNLADIYTNKDMFADTKKESQDTNDSSWDLLDFAKNVINPIGNTVSKLYNSNIGQSIVEKALETNIRSLEGDLARKELRTMQSIEYLKDYEQKRQQLSEALANNDMETAQQLQKYLDDNAQTYDQIIRSNGKLVSLYYNLNDDKSYLEWDTDKASVWERLGVTMSTLFDNKADAYEEAVLRGLGDAVKNIRPKEQVWNNPDRTEILNNLDKVYKDSATAQELKIQKINDRRDILKKGNWFFDPNQIDPAFREKVNNNQFEWGDLSSYPYALPQLGSSLGEIATTVETATLGRLISLAAKKAGTKNPYAATALAIGEFGLNAANSYYQRAQETNAEVFDAYLSNIVDQIDAGNMDPEAILAQGIPQLRDRGVNVDELTFPEILEEMLLYNVKTGDQNFERAKLKAYNGLDNVWQSNMALGVWDAMDMALYSYGGKLAMKSAKDLLKSGGKKLADVTKLTKATDMANKFIDTRLNKALYRMAGKEVYTANKYKDILNTMGRLGTKLGITAFGEGTEEGQQYLIQKDYELQSKYDSTKMGLVDAFLKNFKYGAEANLALMGLHPDDALNNDQELEQNMKIGALIGVIMGGAGTTISDGYQLIRDVKSNNILRNMAAYDISNTEDDAKVDRWYNAVRKGYTTDVMKNLQDIRDRFLPEGLTQEDIDADIKKAAEISSIYNNTNVDPNLQTLGIKRGSEEHKTFVKNAIKAYDVERTLNQQAKQALSDYNNKVRELYDKNLDDGTQNQFRQLVDEYWSNLSETERQEWGTIEALTETIKNIQLTNTTLKVLNKLKKQLVDMSSFIDAAKKNGYDVTNENIAAVVNFINKKQRELDGLLKKDKKISKQLQALFGTNADAELEQLIADQYILGGLLGKAVNRRSAYQNGVVLNVDQNRRADFNLKNWAQLSDEEKQAIRDRFNKDRETPLTDKQVATLYNNELIAQDQVTDDTVESARKYANDIIEADMRRYTQNDRSYDQVRDLESVQKENTRDEARQPITEEELPDFTPTGKGDNSGSQVGEKDTTVKEKEAEPESVDVYTETDEDKLQGEKEVGDIADLDISGMVTVANEVEDVESAKSDMEKAMDEAEKAVSKSESKPKEEPAAEPEPEEKDDTADKITLENMTDAANFTDPEDDYGLTSDDNPFLNPAPEPEVPEVLRSVQVEEAPVELPYVDADQLAEMQDKAVPDAKDYFVDSKGRMFLNGKEVTKEQIDKENAADAYANDPNETLSEKANKLEKDNGTVPGLSSSTSIMNSWLVGKTLFYKPDATNPMKLPFTIKGMKTLHSGEELSIALGNPDFLSDAKIYFVPGETFSSELKEKPFNPNDPSTYRNAAVYMIIDKQGEIYVASYRSNAKAYDDYRHRLGNVEQNTKAVEDLDTLAKQKEKIVQYYLQNCKKDKNGKYILPKEALTHVVPTQVNVSNGLFNNQKDSKGNPIFRNLSECKTFEIPTDPYKILTECTFGYGVGGMQVGYKADPYAIKQLGGDEILSQTGGFSGKITIFPKPSATPRGRFSAPIYLCEKFFRDSSIQKPSQIKLRSHDEEGNPTPSNQQYSNFMEYIIDLIVDGDPYNVLPLIINQGEKTRLSDVKQADVQFLAKKQLGYDEDTDSFYIAVPHKDRGGLYFRQNISRSDIKTNPQIRKAVIWYMMQNFHWNTDKYVLSAPLPMQLRDLATRVLKPGQDKLVLYAGELEFTIDELGLKEENGKFVKRDVAPPALAWAIRSGKLLTDMGDYAFKSAFIYAEDITVDQTAPVVTVSKEPITQSKAEIKEVKAPTKLLDKRTLRGILQKYKEVVTDKTLDSWSIEDIAQFEEYLGKYVRTRQIIDGQNSIVVSTFEKGSIVHVTNKTNDYITQFYDNSNEALGEPLVDLSMDSPLAEELLKKDSNGFLSLSNESIRKIFTYNATREATVEQKPEQKPTKPTSSNYQSRREKARELARNLKQPDANAPKVSRYMTSEEIKEFTAARGQKPALISFVYIYDLDGNPQMLIKTGLKSVFDEIGQEPTYLVTGMYSTEDNEVNRISQDLKQAKNWLMEKLGLDVDQVMVFNGVMRSASNGPRVYGVTRLAVNGLGNIILGQGAGKGIQYHEAWHYTNLLLLSPRERQLVYEDFIKHHPEYRNASVNTIEEAMAEDFRSWAIIQNAKWYNLGYQTIKFFRAVKDFVKSMFGISDNLHTIIYKGINKGKFAQYQMNPASVEEFNKAFTDNGTFFSIPGVSQDRLKNMPSIINPDVYYNVLDSLTSTLLSVFNIRSASDLQKLTDNLDYLSFVIEGNMMTGMSPEGNEQLIGEVLDNWDIFKREIAEQLSTLNIKVTEVEQEEIENDFKNGEKDPSEKYDRVSFEFSKKLNMSFNAKLFFYSIPKMEYNKNKELVQVTDPIFGLNMTEPFEVSWNKIMENLWDIERWEDLENRCLRLGNADPFFKSLYNYLSGDNKPDENTCTQILTTIKSAKNEMLTLQFEDAFEKSKPIQADGITIDSKTTVKAKAGKWTILDSSILRLQKKYPRQWGNLFYVSGMIDKSNPNAFRINKEKLNDAEIDLNLIRDEINEAASPFTARKQRTNDLTDQEIGETAIKAKEDLVKWLNNLGINVDVRSIDYLLYGMESMNSKLPTVEGFDKMYTLLNQSSKGNIRNQIIGNLKELTDGETKQLKLNNPFPAAEGSFIQKLAIAHGKSHPNPAEFSVTGPNNTTIYPITQNNYMSDRIRWFNNDPSEVNKTKRATYNQHSRLLQALQDGSKLNLGTFIAVRNDDNKTSRDYFEISPIEDYISKMVLAHNDRIVLPTMADKKTWYAISGVKLFHDILSKSKPKDVQEAGRTYQIYVDSDTYSYSNDTLDVFADYLLDEFNVIEEYYANKSQVEKNPNLRIDNYHGKIKNGKMDNSGNGGYFRYFSSIKMRNDDGSFSYVPLNQLLWSWSKFDYDNNQNQMLTRLKQLKNNLFGDRERLLESINATLQDKVQEELDFLVNKGIIRKKGNEYENVLLPQDIMDYYKEASRKLKVGNTSRRNVFAQVYSAVANHVVNEMSSIIELEKAFVGDPAYYKWKRDKKQPWIITERSVDKIKRLGSVLSTGDNLRTYWGDGDSRNNTKFTVLHVADNNVGSIKFDEYRKMFTAAEIMKYIERTNPNIEQSRLVKMVNRDNVAQTLKTLNPKVRKQIEDSVIRQIAAYGVDENGRGRINQADAAVYIRPALYKRIVQAVGEWSTEVETAFDLLESDDQSWLSDPKLYAQAIETLIKPLKMVYFGNHELTKLGLNVPVFDKMAIFPMFKVLAKADNYQIYKRMNDEELGTIDMLTFESAVKVGGRQKYVPYKDAQNSELNMKDLFKPSTSIVNGETNLEGLDSDNSKLPTYIQDLRNLRLQMNTDPHEHTDRSLGTQFAKVALSNLVKTRPYGGNKGVEYTGRQIINNIFGAINKLSDIGAQSIFNEFVDKDGQVSSKKLSDFLVRQAKDSGLSRDAIQSLEIDETTGEMKVPLSAQSNRRFIESRIISQVGKKAIDINTPGGSAIQHAFFGFKNTTGVKQEEVGRAFNDGKDLSPLNEDGSMDCMLSTNFFRHVVPSKIQRQGYTAIREWLIEKNIIGQNAKPYALGYRIPTQGLSSTASFKVTDVLPESMGDVIVVPNDFTAMTGSDFDIDKLYIAVGYYDKDGNYLQCNWDNIDSNSEKQLVNGLIDMYRIAISDDSNIDQTKAPLDNLTEKVKSNILPLVVGTSKEEAKPMYELMPSYQLFKKFEYTGGKDGIAPFALASTNHALTQALNLRMHLGKVGETYNLGNINDITSQDGERILDWLSAMINAHVDVAKDPYIINLNVNAVTYSMTEFLLRTGKGEATFYFLSQPVLKDFANAIINLNGQYGVDPTDSSYKQLIDDTLSKARRQYVQEALKYADTQDESTRNNMRKLINAINDGKDESHDSDAVNIEKLKAALTSNINGNRDLNFYLQQILVSQSYQAMLPYADRLTKLVRLSQIDTKKYGNTLAQQSNYSKQVFDFINKEQDMFYQVDDKGVAIEDEKQNALFNYYVDSFLMKKLKNAVDIPKYILHNDYIQATLTYGGLYNNMINTLLGERAGVNKLLAVKLDGIIDSVIRARIADNTEALRLEWGDLRDMVLGNRTLPKRLHQLKYAIYKNNDGRYDNLRNGDGSISNSFLNYLIPTLDTGEVEGGMDVITLLNSSMSNSSNFENRLIAYFSDLLNSDDAAVKQFAHRLVLFAYYTSYDNKGPNTFAHLLSGQFRMETGYAQNVRQTIQDMNNGNYGDNLFDENLDNPELNSFPSVAITIARNNAQDSEIVKNIVRPKSKTYNSQAFITSTAPWNDNQTYLMSFSVNSRKDERDFLSVDYPYAGNRNTILYVKIGRIEVYDKAKSKKLGQATQTVYAAVPTLGYQRGSNSVKEYYKRSWESSDFDENNITTLSYKFLKELYNDQDKYRMTVKGVKTQDIDISLVPSQYFTEDFNKYGLEKLGNNEPIEDTTTIDKPVNEEVNDEKPTMESTKPKSKAVETKEIDKDVAAEAGLLDKGNLMTKVNQQLMLTEALSEADDYTNPLAGVESSGEDISSMFTTEDDLSEDNFSDEAYNICKGK